MRHGTSSPNNRRQRNRSNNNGGRRNPQQQRTQVYDSNGPDVRIRGNAHQVAEKYLALAKDATSVGDHIVAENYFQHAEHYIRLINEFSGSFDNKKLSGDNRNDSIEDDAGNKHNKSEEDDLSLPASIIGAEVTSKSSSEKVEEEA